LEHNYDIWMEGIVTLHYVQEYHYSMQMQLVRLGEFGGSCTMNRHIETGVHFGFVAVVGDMAHYREIEA